MLHLNDRCFYSCLWVTPDLRCQKRLWILCFSTTSIGTFSNADFCDGDGDRKSNLFPVDVLHFGGKPFSLRADVRTASFPLSTKRRYIFCFHALNIYHFFLIWFPKASKRPTQYIIAINLGFRLHIVFKYSS